jgi:hypothetical protein
MRWTRGKFWGRKPDGQGIEYVGYTAGSFGVTRQGRRVTYYDVIHLPTGVSIRPRSLWIPKLAQAKLYAEAVSTLQGEEAWRSTTLPLGVADKILEISRGFE